MNRTNRGYANPATVIAVVIGLAVSVAVGAHLYRQETRRIHQQFRITMDDRVDTFQRALDMNLETVISLKALFDAVDKVDRSRFHTFAEQALQRHPAIRALEWVPRVPAAEREKVEAAARLAGHADFRFTELREGRIARAGSRSEYFPVYFVEPFAPNEPAFGFDLGSDPVRRAALDLARDRGRMAVTSRLNLVQERDERSGFLVLCPVYRGPAANTAERRENLAGMIVGAYQVETILEQAGEIDTAFRSGVALKLIDPQAPSGTRTLYTRAVPGARTDYERTIDLTPDDGWTLQAGVGPTFVAGERTWQPLLAALVGVLLTLGVVCYVHVVAGRAVAVRALVDERTRELSEATARLEGQKDILQSVLDNLGDGVVLADDQGKLTLFNPAARRILGQGPTDSGPERWSEFYGLFDPVTDEPIPVERLPLSRALAGEECRDAELLVRNPNRDNVFIRVTATPIRGSTGKPRGGVAVFRDITARKWTEGQLRESEHRFRAIVEATASALIIVSPQWRIQEFNAQAERIYGVTRGKALGQDFFSLCLPPEFRRAVAADLERALAGERTPGFETPVQPQSGAERTLLWSFSRLADSEDRSGVIIATAHDITERRQAEEARRVRELAGHLQSARENERAYIAREIHDELGQALTGLKFEISSLKRRSERSDAELHRRLGALATMIDDTIRGVRRLAASLRPQILDELGLLEAIRWQVREFGRHTGIDCRLELPDEEIAWDADRATAMFRVLQESLTNVARHAQADQVDIRVRADGPQVVLEVRDDGKGVTEEALNNGRSFGVLGMRERARMFGGVLKIQRGPERGTTVTVRMPV